MEQPVSLALIGSALFILGALLTFAVQQWRISSLRKGKNAVQLSLQSKEAELQAREFDVKQLNQSHTAVTDDLQAAQEHLSTLQKALDSERDNLQSVRLEHATDKEALAGVRRELSDYRDTAQQQRNALKAQLDEAQQDVKARQTQQDELNKQLTELKSGLSDRESRLESRETSLKEAQQRINTLDQELTSLRESSQEKLGALNKDLAQVREALGSAQADLKSRTLALEEIQTKLASTENTLNQQRKDYQKKLDDAYQIIAELREANGSIQSDLHAVNANLKEAREQRDIAQKSLKELQTTYHALKNDHGELQTRMEEKGHQFNRQLQWMEDSKKQLKVEFENLANELLDQKGKAFSSLSERNLTELLKPFQTEIKGFRDKVESLHTQETEQRASLRTELRHLQDLNKDITEQAAQLTQALKGQKKVQGNWGELMLENVLDSAGLRPGDDYQRERSFDTEEGKRRPDAVIYLPQGRHLVIDAKTSLNAYLEYVNADDDLSRQHALAEHTKAVSSRITELADKHYYDLPGLNSPEVVVMFIPIESAYVEAVRYDSTLYQRAIENNVLVATPITLLTSLNIVSQLWRFENQSKHSAELASRAERFYNKLSSFVESMQDVGKKLDGARGSYDKALGQLVNGRGNLIKQAHEFKELGVSVKKELPADILERAKLEIGPSTDQSHYLENEQRLVDSTENTTS
ncbi:DNA recombination protein RmuC [Halomonas alkaliantarctica]|uniref:DNA recombination protein RmuC n=1 Tax=Halomonas alkaliantarctica TaxID=232346 RepID=UPI0026596D4B|nr:DNA recombination protein RmuC [Halomonas alkaliantarctica]